MNKLTKQFKPEDTFIPLNVYKFPLGHTGGVTDLTRLIYIPCKRGGIYYKDITSSSLIFLPVKKDTEYWALIPLEQPIQGFRGPMSGGNLAYISDSRCERVYHIHDRYERIK